MNPQQEIDALNAILDAIVNSIEEITASGEELPDELQGILAEEITLTISRISQLLQEIQITENPTEPTFPTEPEEEPENLPGGGGAPPEIPEIEPAPHESSNVNGFSYDRKNKRLYVQFHGPYPQAAGSTYSYEGVNPGMFDLIRRGAIAPRTSGRNQYHEWISGVTPSHGASVNHILKEGGYQYSRLS